MDGLLDRSIHMHICITTIVSAVPPQNPTGRAENGINHFETRGQSGEQIIDEHTEPNSTWHYCK
jgi:hypothetical protein